MPAQQDPVTDLRAWTWTLTTIADFRELQDTLAYLGVDSSVWRHMHPDARSPLRMEVPDTKIRTNPTVYVERTGSKVRTTTSNNDTVLVNIELLEDGA